MCCKRTTDVASRSRLRADEGAKRIDWRGRSGGSSDRRIELHQRGGRRCRMHSGRDRRSDSRSVLACSALAVTVAAITVASVAVASVAVSRSARARTSSVPMARVIIAAVAIAATAAVVIGRRMCRCRSRAGCRCAAAAKDIAAVVAIGSARGMSTVCVSAAGRASVLLVELSVA